MLMGKCISVPNRWSMFFKQLIKEIYKLGVDSLWIVVIISIFIGTVIAIQISLNISSPLIPKFTIGYTTREIILLEFSSSIMSLILAGKVGSNIASEIGTMRVTEQIDAMEIMGVNSANFLIPLLRFNGTLGLLGGTLGFFLVERLRDGLPYFLVVASSSFIYVALADLIPQLQKRLTTRETAAQIVWLGVGIGLVTLVSRLAHGH